MEFTAEQFSDVAGLSLAFDPLDSFEDLCAELDTGATTGVFATGSQAINAYFDTPSDAVSAAAANVAPAATRAPRKKKQRNLVNARNAQRRFRERQKVQSESILGQLSVTTAELRELKSRQQHLEARNVLLEKVAELNTVQQSGNWGEQQAVLDFACAHTQPTEQGHALTLTIWGQAECTSARSVSNMSIPEITSLWTEYVRRLGTLLDLSTSFCTQQLELMMLSEGQVQDLLYLYQLENARVAQLKAQREAAVSKLMGNSQSADAILKQHPSDSITVSNDVADQLRKIGLAQYKLRGIVYDAFFHGVLTSMQSALALVHSYPLFMHPEPLLDALAQQHGQAATSALPFEVSSFNQLLGHKAGPSARRGFDHEVLHPLKLRPWQAKIRGRSDEDIVREALMSRMDKC
ncbi:hypothetical protein WJX79_006461 [Trebouxia sp. C0005]